ncbi:MAG: GTP pyrophosphokinase family protein [Firmicutes bacterium]|nr:GTP pyrophosphokinase family protein [Bacillota bacterium]
MSPEKSVTRFETGEFDKLKSSLVIYRCALKMIETKLTNLNDYYAAFYEGNPIEHTAYRIKSPESIAGKLKARNLPITAEAAVANLLDIAGARIICSYAKNIREIADIIRAQHDLTIVSEKDYLSAPKASGYRSYHIVAEVRPGIQFGEQCCPVEIQIRTSAMDFWASLEHKVRYKYGGQVPDHFSRELQLCAEKINELDERMYLIHELVELVNE